MLYLIYFGYSRLFSTKSTIDVDVDDHIQIKVNSGNAASSKQYPFRKIQNPKLELKKRLDDLLGRLTLEEVVLQSIAPYSKPTPAIDRLGIQPFVWITECLHGQYQTSGTTFPQALGLAATFRCVNCLKGLLYSYHH